MRVEHDAPSIVAQVLSYSIRDSHAHKPAHGLQHLSEDHLPYCPIPELALDWEDAWRWPSLQTPRRILMHTIFSAHHYAGIITGAGGAEWSSEWIPEHLGDIAGDPEALVRALDNAFNALCASALHLCDADGDTDELDRKLLVLLEGGILHTAWHLGQISMLIDWYFTEDDGHTLAAPSRPPGEFVYDRHSEASPAHISSRHDVVRSLAELAYSASPAHALRNVVTGMTKGEMAWRPFPSIEDIWWARAMWVIVIHTWSPKIVYIDHALGGRTLNYGAGDNEIAGCEWGETDPGRHLFALEKAHGWLIEHVTRASDDDLCRVNPMHIDHPMAGWQAAVCMAQHDAWHAGQLAIMRDVYAALWARQG